MNRASAPATKNSMRTFILFCVVVFLLITISLTLKTVHTIQRSIYDPKHTFILAVSSPSQTVLYGIDPDSHEVSVLRIAAKNKEVRIGEDLGIPVDAVIRQKGNLQSSFKKQVQSLVLNSGKLTWYDTLRLMITAGSYSENTPIDISLDSPSLSSESFTTLFSEKNIVDEGATIAIVNATGASGFGGRLERVLTTLGGTVVSVTTAQKEVQHSAIKYIHEDSYTLKRVERLLGYPITPMEGEGISDILIVLGKDSLSTTVF